MKRIRLLHNTGDCHVELSVVHITGEEEGVSAMTDLLFIAQGELSLSTSAGAFTEKQDDIFLLNKGENYSFRADDCVAVSLQLDPGLFHEREEFYFECNSAASVSKEKYYNLKHLLARMVKISADTNQRPEYLTRSIVNLLLHELFSAFRGAKKSAGQSKKYFERMELLTRYINDNFRENLSLGNVADYAHLSVPYLSTFFDKYFGMSFLSYYTTSACSTPSPTCSAATSPSKISHSTTVFPTRAHSSPPSAKNTACSPASTANRRLPAAPMPQGRKNCIPITCTPSPNICRNAGSSRTKNTIPVSQNFSEEIIDLSGDLSAEKSYLSHNFRKNDLRRQGERAAL